MKKAMIECDICHKAVEEKTSTFATMFISKNGMTTERADFCEECLRKILNFTEDGKTEKGGNDVECIECEFIMFSDCYGECSKAYRGIVSPHDSCGKGKRKGSTGK